MKPFFFTPAAADDLFSIWSYIAEHDLSAADRVEAEIISRCSALADNPEIGHKRADLTSLPVQFYTVRGTYLIVFDPASNPLELSECFTGRGMLLLNWDRAS